MGSLHSVSVTGIVKRDDGRVLVIKRADDGLWVPPGGGMELGETPQEAVVRELEEETGYLVTVGRLSAVYKNMRTAVVTLGFVCRLAGGHARCSDESAAVEWWTLDQVDAGMLEARGIRVHDALAGGETLIRIHDGTNLIESGPAPSR